MSIEGEETSGQQSAVGHCRTAAQLAGWHCSGAAHQVPFILCPVMHQVGVCAIMQVS